MPFNHSSSNSQSTAWNRPPLQETLYAGHRYQPEGLPVRDFLAAEHRDSWSPDWKGNRASRTLSGNYDFLMA